MPPQIVQHPTAGEFLRAAEPWLERTEAEHNLLIGVARNMAASPPPIAADWLTLEAGGEIVAAAMRTPPHNPVLSDMPADAVAAVVEFYRERDPGLGGVFSTSETAARFVEGWRIATSCDARIHMRMLFSCCRRPGEPRAATGHVRPLAAQDAPRLAEFVAGFHADVGGDPPPDDLLAAARGIIDQGSGRA